MVIVGDGPHPVPTSGERPSFDHRSTGTAETRWANWHPDTDRPIDLTRFERLVVLAAHPDDETLGAGGTIATAAALGVPVVVIVASNGERSHPDSPTHSPQRLAEIRRREVTAAVTRLAPAASLFFLDLPDGSLGGHLAELTAALDPLVTERTLLLAPWTGDRHPDHAATGTAARRVADTHRGTCWQYPIWAWHWAEPTSSELVGLRWQRVDLAAEPDGAKRAALLEHRSQHSDLSPAPDDAALLRPDFQEHFRRSFELFVHPGPGRPDAAGASLGREFFDDMYSADADPWQFRHRWYEERKREITLASLPRRRFRSAFEPGCSIGVLTELLAARCDHLLATDISAAPLRTAADRVTAAQVRFEVRRIPDEWPAGQFDLVVLSEVGYYCSAADLRILADRAAGSLSEDGVLLGCHWRHPVTAYPLSGDEVHRVLHERTGLTRLVHHEEEDFVLDVWSAAGVASVARVEGLVG